MGKGHAGKHSWRCGRSSVVSQGQSDLLVKSSRNGAINLFRCFYVVTGGESLYSSILLLTSGMYGQ